jgi:hypothetical protein
MPAAKPFTDLTQSRRALLGKPISHAIAELIRLIPEVARVSFAAYRPAPGLDTRLALNTDPTADIRKEAEQLRQEFGIPFWDAVLSISMKRGNIPSRYVELAILHDKSPDDYYVNVARTEITTSTIDSLVEGLKPGFVLALSSKVELIDGASAHIPMMDFRCAPGDKNAMIVKNALAAMGEIHGFLVNSGRSYHYYGLRLLSADTWAKFLAMAILFTPVVDARYVAHRLADGACRLRVGTGPEKPSTPTVEEVF